MLVEDDPQVRELARTILRSFGYHVLTADTAAQAVWVWERHQNHIVLMITDMMIPNCATGAELARKFQSEKPELRVLFTSGFGPEIGEDDTIFRDKSLFLQKPFTPTALMRMVADALRQEPAPGPGRH